MARILVVDDDDEQRGLLRDCLIDGGFEVLTAGDGIDGLSRFQQEQALDLMIVDLYMPGMDGLELAASVRDSGRKVPVIALTTETNPELILQADCAEISFWVIKPFQSDTLLKGVQTIIEQFPD